MFLLVASIENRFPSIHLSIDFDKSIIIGGDLELIYNDNRITFDKSSTKNINIQGSLIIMNNYIEKKSEKPWKTIK